ncbi:hypothetical protein [Selenomonas sp. AB3002]|uniref:hypothetical protein n=1 Tax=Selenomonas sp. AB3002 TaxID=1392502 RepID=UPI00049737CD
MSIYKLISFISTIVTLKDIVIAFLSSITPLQIIILVMFTKVLLTYLFATGKIKLWTSDDIRGLTS